MSTEANQGKRPLTEGGTGAKPGKPRKPAGKTNGGIKEGKTGRAPRGKAGK